MMKKIMVAAVVGLVFGSAVYYVGTGRVPFFPSEERQADATPPVAKSFSVKALTSRTGKNVDKGKRVFEQNCLACHGLEGSGGNPAKINGGIDENGNYIAPALNGTAHTWHHPESLLFDIIKNGSPDPKSPMRGFDGKLSDGEIANVILYVKSLWPEKILQMYESRKGAH